MFIISVPSDITSLPYPINVLGDIHCSCAEQLYINTFISLFSLLYSPSSTDNPLFFHNFSLLWVWNQIAFGLRECSPFVLLRMVTKRDVCGSIFTAVCVNNLFLVFFTCSNSTPTFSLNMSLPSASGSTCCCRGNVNISLEKGFRPYCAHKSSTRLTLWSILGALMGLLLGNNRVVPCRSFKITYFSLNIKSALFSLRKLCPRFIGCDNFSITYGLICKATATPSMYILRGDFTRPITVTCADLSAVPIFLVRLLIFRFNFLAKSSDIHGPNKLPLSIST